MSDRPQNGSSRLIAVGVIAGVVALVLAIVPAFGAGGSGNDANSRRAPSEASAQAAGQGGVTFFAVVSSRGRLARGPAVLSTARLGTGSYEVIFAFGVRRCAYVATIGKTGFRGAPESGGITTAARASDRRGVFVASYSSGNLANRPFHLVVTC